MSCTNCLKTYPLPICNGSILIGTISVPDQPVVVLIKNITSGATFTVNDSSGSAGEISIVKNDYFNIHDTFEVSVSVGEYIGNDKPKNKLIYNTIETDCVLISFFWGGDEYAQSIIEPAV